MNKIWIMFIFLLLISGCSPQYNLKIDGDNIEEQINLSIDKNKIIEEDLSPEMNIYSKESINYIINEDIYPIMNNHKNKYDKKVEESNGFINITLNYIYSVSDYSNSNTLKNCFSNYKVEENNKEIYIFLTGKFNCLEENDEFQFVIETKNRVLENNADSRNSNKYIWNINSSNKDDINIEIKLSKQSIFSYYLVYIISGTIVLSIIIIGIVAFSKIKNRTNVNKI